MVMSRRENKSSVEKKVTSVNEEGAKEKKSLVNALRDWYSSFNFAMVVFLR